MRLARAEELADLRLRVVREIVESRSWRMTAPFRNASARLRGVPPPELPAEPPLPAPPERVEPGTFTPPRTDTGEGEGLRARPWRSIDGPPAAAREIPAMIIDDERRLLYWLARDYWSDAGRILDAGSYLGASTAALAAGLAARDQPPGSAPIASYDRFILDYFMLPHLPQDSELDEGDSFRELFDRNLEPWAHFVEVREGDLREIGWSGEPIEIAFFDVLKTWPLNDFVLGEFFGSMIPGRTMLIQQDFVGEFCPWVHVTMGMLDPYVELLDLFEWGSAVYLIRDPIPQAILETRTTRDLTPAQLLAFMDTAIAPASGAIRGTLEVAKGTLLRWVEGFEAMEEHLNRVEDEYEGSHRVMRSIEIVRGWGIEMGYGPLRLRGKRDSADAISPPA